ncbi:MAG: asparaginase domain-containing protein, partial [Desulfonatronovibrionaceae bacterium]
IAQYPVPEVCLCFGSRLLRRCRAKKMDAGGFDAFDSPNFPHLGQMGIDISVRRDLVLWPGEQEFRLNVQRFGKVGVASLRLFPGISPVILDNILKEPLQGLVLESYGSGNGPSKDKEFLQVLSRATERGVVLVNCTQCVRGTVRGDYEAGLAMKQAGVVSGLDMTAEAALSKLYCLLQRGFSPPEIRDLVQKNLRGELTSMETGPLTSALDQLGR